MAGCEIHDDPYDPVCVRCRALAAELGDDLPISWRHRDDRYTEKLATPDTSVGDLIGDVDPVKVAQGRTLGDPETVHYGLVPRANRGVFGLNELPDLAERIQVALFNVLEERDIQVRGYSLRLPLDVFVVATANPEDYTNRGRIITPLKDRFGAEIRTHYLAELSDEIALLRQEAQLVAEVGDHLLEVIARFVRLLRESSSIDQRSGVSARFAIAAAEAVSGSALRRSARTGDVEAVARICDVGIVLPTLLGKVEFEMGEEGREHAVLDHLLRLAMAATFRERLAGIDLSGFTAVFAEGAVVETGELVPAADLLEPARQRPGSVQGARPAGLRRRRGPGSGGRRRRVHPGGPAPDPADREGERRRPYRLRRVGVPWPLTLRETAATSVSIASATGRGGVGRTRWPRRTTSAPPSTRSARTCCRPATSATRLRDLMRGGLDGRGGLDRLAAKIPKLRAQARRRGDLGGTLDQVRGALDQALAAERETLAGTDSDAARLAEMDLATLPDDVAGAVRALAPLRLAVRRGAEPLPGHPGHAAARGAGRPVRRDEAGPGVGRSRGHAARQGHAGRPERAAGGARPAGGHRRPVSRLHGQARRPVPRAAGDRRRADRRPGPAAGRGPADDGVPVARTARAARPADEPSPERRRPGLGDGPAERQPAGAAPGDGSRVPGGHAPGRGVAGLQRRGRGRRGARRPGGSGGPAVARRPGLGPG